MCSQQQAAANGFLVEALADEAAMGGWQVVAAGGGDRGQAGAFEAGWVGLAAYLPHGTAGGLVVGWRERIFGRVIVARRSGMKRVALLVAPDFKHVSLSL